MDQPRDFELKLRVHRGGVVKRLKTADCLKATGDQSDLRGTEISRGSFKRVCRPFNCGRIAIGQGRPNIGQHRLVAIQKEMDELAE
jgi:hypothetical protein